METQTYTQDEKQRDEVNLPKQLLFSFIDIGLCFLLISLVTIYRTPTELYQLLEPINSTLGLLMIIILYRLCSFSLLGQTFGMKLFRVVLRNGQGKKLSGAERMLASFFILYKGVGYYDQ
jgi:hypothetical protein